MLVPLAVAAAAMVTVLLGWQGEDVPAQLYRVDLVRKAGLTLWNNGWYGGHATLGYSVLFPLLGSVFGLYAVAIASVLVATVSADRLLRARAGAWGSFVALVFGLGLTSNVVIGRLTFLLGFALGLAALWAFDQGRMLVAVGLAIGCGLSSPVAAVFVALAGVAVALATSRRRDGIVLAAAAVVAPLVVMIREPVAGDFPYRFDVLSLTLLGALLVGVFTKSRSLRVAAALYAIGCIGLFAVPNSLGGNACRLAMYATFPALAVVSRMPRWMLLIVIAPLALAWQWIPAWDAIAKPDASLHASYFGPVLDYARVHLPVGARVEIPTTASHWEAAHVATVVPLARGWERQQDRERNPIFYGPDGVLDAHEYERWLHENAVAIVALPAVRMDFSSRQEAALLRTEPEFLQRVWSDADWIIWQVRNPAPIVNGPAELVEMTADSLRMEFSAPGVAVVRVRYTDLWDAHGDDACVDKTADGWLVIRSERTGAVDVSTRMSAADGCDNTPGR
jgi:hypothetical protein